MTIIVALFIITYTYFNHSTLNVNVAILWHYNKAQHMYTCFIYYAKCIHDYFHICIRSMECEINEWMNV